MAHRQCSEAGLDVASAKSIREFYAACSHVSGSPAIKSGSELVDGSRMASGLQPEDKAPVIWRSREGGVLQADNGADNDIGILWALKDHVRTIWRPSAFSSTQVVTAAQNNSRLQAILKDLQQVRTASSAPYVDPAGLITDTGRPSVWPETDYVSVSAAGVGTNVTSHKCIDGHSPEELEAFAVYASSHSGDDLHSRFLENWRNVYSRRTDFLALFCTTRPFTAAMTTQVVQLIVLTAGLLLLLSSPQNVVFTPSATLRGMHRHEYSSLRFTATELSSGLRGDAIGSSGLSTFGLLDDRCTLPTDLAGRESSGASEYIYLTAPASFNGWYVVSHTDSGADVPVRFLLEGSTDNTTWHSIAISSECGSVTASQGYGTRPTDTKLPKYSKIAPGGGVFRFDFTADECLFPDMMYVVIRWVVSLSLIAAAAVGLLHSYTYSICVTVGGESNRCKPGRTDQPHKRRTFDAPRRAAPLVVCVGYVLAALVSLGTWFVLSVVHPHATVMRRLLDKQPILLMKSLAVLFICPAPWLLSEAYAIESIIVYAGIQILTNVIFNHIEYVDIFVLLVSVGVLVMRERVSRGATHAVKEDKERLEAAWKEVLQKGGDTLQQQHLAELASILDQVSQRQEDLVAGWSQATVIPTTGLAMCALQGAGVWGGQDALRSVGAEGSQLIHLPRDKRGGGHASGAAGDDEPGVSRGFLCSLDSSAPKVETKGWARTGGRELRKGSSAVSRSVSHVSAVKCLDQLHAQAFAVEPYFSAKVQAWAERFKGAYMLRGAGGADGEVGGGGGMGSYEFVDAGTAACERQVMRQVRQQAVKSMERTISKLACKHDGNVAAMCDLVRQRLVFDSLEALVQCVRAITSDRQVVIAGIKDRLSLSRLPARSAGYRALILGLCIEDETTHVLGVSRHVCELQLTLRAMARELSPAQHVRYLVYRRTEFKQTPVWRVVQQAWRALVYRGVIRSSRVVPEDVGLRAGGQVAHDSMLVSVKTEGGEPGERGVQGGFKEEDEGHVHAKGLGDGAEGAAVGWGVMGSEGLGVSLDTDVDVAQYAVLQQRTCFEGNLLEVRLRQCSTDCVHVLGR
jgi:hypothetical protein